MRRHNDLPLGHQEFEGLQDVYATARKCTQGFKENMKIIFDNHLPKWNYRAVPQTG